MQQLVECVPNFSEGRDAAVYNEIADAIRSVRTVNVLDVSADPDHNRTVVTFIGKPADVEEAAFRGISKAAERINLDYHEGEHPRIGATDVCPFIPIRGVTIEECVAMANRLAQRVGEELGIAVYLYGNAATSPEREKLSNIRKGQYELWKAEVETNPARQPTNPTLDMALSWTPGGLEAAVFGCHAPHAPVQHRHTNPVLRFPIANRFVSTRIDLRWETLRALNSPGLARTEKGNVIWLSDWQRERC